MKLKQIVSLMSGMLEVALSQFKPLFVDVMEGRTKKLKESVFGYWCFLVEAKGSFISMEFFDDVVLFPAITLLALRNTIA